MIGASSYADDDEDERIKDREKEVKKKEREEKKKAKAAEKARKRAVKGQEKNGKNEPDDGISDEEDEKDDEDEDDYFKSKPQKKSSYFVSTVGKHFAELSSGMELLPLKLLGKKPKKFERFTASDGSSYDVPAKWNEKYLDLFLDDAKKAGVKVRFHLLVCPEMSPDWFFFRDYDTASHLVGKAEMTARLEWYIRTVTDYIFDWEYKHNQGKRLVTSYDVVSELFTDTEELNLTLHNFLLKIYGDSSYAVQSFGFVARNVPSSVKLCYCEHSLFDPGKAGRVKDFIRSVRSAGGRSRVDEIGIISHLTADWPERDAFFGACKDFSSFGVDVQIQQLDIASRTGKDSGTAYYDFLKACIGHSAYIQGVSFRAVKAVDRDDSVDYMRRPLFTGDYSCTVNFDRVIEASGRGYK